MFFLSNIIIIIILIITGNNIFINSSLNSVNNRENIINNMSFQQTYNTNNIFPKKNLIVGIIVRYSWRSIAPFFKSLMKANYTNCDIVMFVREVSFLVIKYLYFFGVIIYKIPDKYRKLKVPRYRWKMYIDFLKKEKDKYKLVISADIRDTIIQDDIFKYYENHKPFIGFSTETSNLNEIVNKGWIIKIFGKNIHKAIMNQNIINAGIMIGTVDEYLKFSIKIWDNLLVHQKATDQCIVNYLIYYKKLFNDSLVLSNEYGPIMTIGLINYEDIIVDSRNNIINFGGKIAAWVHQYDRVGNIGNIMKGKFSPEILDVENKNKNTLN